MGIRLINKSPRLILKPKKRNLNMTGAITMRPCFCDIEGVTPKGLCPIHDFWDGAQRGILPNEPLHPPLQGENLNRILKAISERMQIPSAFRYSTKAFRRGAAMDIMASGSTIAQIMRSAGWHSQAFRAYLMFQMEEECDTKAIFASSDRSKTKAKYRPPRATAKARNNRPSSTIDISPVTSDSTSSGIPLVWK